MTSAEKKAPEPSMDDIISSIRNIIADDTPDNASASGDVDTNSPKPVVQLTENQIAESSAAVIGERAVGDVAAAPSAIPNAGTDAQIASEIDAVPGSGVQTEIAAVSSASMAPEIPTPSEITAPPENLAASIDSAPVPVTQQVAAPEPTIPAATTTGAEPPADDIAFSQSTSVQSAAAPDVPVIMDPPVTSELAISPLDEALDEPGDPVGEMMRAADAEPMSAEAFNNDVDPDRILDGMDSVSASDAAPENPMEPGTSTPQSVILDASQVTPEDAAAITAVAAATSEALAGTSEPATKQTDGSFEDGIKAMLKPMIREWLDDNMPRILEGVVKEEVEGAGNDDL